MDNQQLRKDLDQLAKMADQSRERVDELAGQLRVLCAEIGELLGDPDLSPAP